MNIQPVEEDQEIHDIFSKDIEESLPELFGSYKSSMVNLNLADSGVEKKLTSSMPNVISKPKPVEIDALRSRGALGVFNSVQDKLALAHKTETETENDEYNEDAEDEDEESSSYSSFKNADKLDKLPKQAIKVNNAVDSTTDSISVGNASSTSSSDEYDYKSIDKNAFKKASSATDTSAAKLNDEIEKNFNDEESPPENENFLNENNGGFYNGSVYKSESDYFFHNGIGIFNIKLFYYLKLANKTFIK